MDPNRLMTKTLETAPWGAGVARILAAALQAVDPYEAVAKAFQRSGDELQVAGQTYPLARATAAFTWWGPARRGSRWQKLPRRCSGMR